MRVVKAARLSTWIYFTVIAAWEVWIIKAAFI
jgi:hypothetical protein